MGPSYKIESDIVYVYMYMYTHTYIHLYIYMYICVCVYTYVCVVTLTRCAFSVSRWTTPATAAPPRCTSRRARAAPT